MACSNALEHLRRLRRELIVTVWVRVAEIPDHDEAHSSLCRSGSEVARVAGRRGRARLRSQRWSANRE